MKTSVKSSRAIVRLAGALWLPASLLLGCTTDLECESIGAVEMDGLCVVPDAGEAGLDGGGARCESDASTDCGAVESPAAATTLAAMDDNDAGVSESVRAACTTTDLSKCPAPPRCHQTACSDEGWCQSVARPDGTHCKGGVCSHGSCVECITDGDCPNDGDFCQMNACVQCRRDSDCSTTGECSTASCANGSCGVVYADEGTPCVGTGYCNGLASFSSCVDCTKDDHCPGGHCSAGSACVDCLDDDDCDGSDYCSGGECKTPRCGDGRLDLGLNEQCDPGATSVPGCVGCRIEGDYGPCETVGSTTSGACLNFGTSGGASPPMFVPRCSFDEACPSVPGGPWTPYCSDDDICFLGCATGDDCPHGYGCTGQFCLLL